LLVLIFKKLNTQSNLNIYHSFYCSSSKINTILIFYIVFVFINLQLTNIKNIKIEEVEF